MTPIEAINAEAYRRHLASGRVDYYDIDHFAKFADIRDQLIKEGWAPPLDDAEMLLMQFDNSPAFETQNALRAWKLAVVQSALAKARAHPADVVEAAKALHGKHTSRESIAMADYLLKEVS